MVPVSTLSVVMMHINRGDNSSQNIRVLVTGLERFFRVLCTFWNAPVNHEIFQHV